MNCEGLSVDLSGGKLLQINIIGRQLTNLVQQQVDLLTVDQANVTLAQQSPHDPLHVSLVYLHHHHESHQVVEHGGQEPVLVVLQSFLLVLAEVLVPLHHLPGPGVHASSLPLTRHRVQEDVFPELTALPQRGPSLGQETLEYVVPAMIIL